MIKPLTAWHITQLPTHEGHLMISSCAVYHYLIMFYFIYMCKSLHQLIKH
jgi:hypothetical protein